MRQPLNGTITVTGEFKEKAQLGTGLADGNGVRRHIGVDLRASVGTDVYAPAAGVVTASYGDGKSSTVVEIRINGQLWRFMHLSKRLVNVGDHVSEGQVFAKSGNSGGVAAHLHVDVRSNNTKWDQSLNNYFDYRTILTEANAPKPAPSTGQRLMFTSIGQVATFFKVSGGEFKMKIVDFEGWRVLAKEPRRVKVNSRSAGGDCWVYLIDSSGKTIPGRYLK